MATYCWVPFLPRETPSGVTVIETSGLVVTVKTEVPRSVVRPFATEAVMVADPVATDVAIPAVLTVAMRVLLEDHVTVPGIGATVPLE